MKSDYHFQEFIEKKVLILGDIRTGKTRLMIRLFKESLEIGLAEDVSVIDLAPKIVEVNGRKIGGKISDFIVIPSNVRYFTAEVVPPRLTAKSRKELLSLISLNKRRIDKLLKDFLNDPMKVLFVNDISIYFQSGKRALIASLVDVTETFVANGYYGKSFEYDFSTGVSKREKELMEKLAKRMDFTIRL